MKLLNARETRALEQAAVEHGAGWLELMENAGAAAVRFLRKKFTLPGKRFVVLCGKGNNGGDGFVAARLLAEQGAAEISVVLAQGLPVTENARTMLARLRGLPVKIINSSEVSGPLALALASVDFILDAVYGTGFHGAAPQELVSLFQAANRSGAVTLAFDMPSGACCDDGSVQGECIRADYTVSFAVYKAGQFLRPAMNYCGQTAVVPIGIDSALCQRQPAALELLEQEFVQAALPARPDDSNKGSFGRLLCLCGSSGMAGAAILSATAAARCGAGLVDVALPRSIYPIVAARLPEAVYTLLEETDLREPLRKAAACLIGCGLGRRPFLENLVPDLVNRLEIPLVLDADGINIIAEHKDVLKTAKGPRVLTPHPGEMARLMGVTVAEVQAHRLEYAVSFAQEYQVVLVLKGAGTLVACPNGRVYLNTTGNPGMAKGGSGDVLAGMVASFLTQGLEPAVAAACAVYLHGRAGDVCAQALSQTAMLPTDLLERLPELFLELGR